MLVTGADKAEALRAVLGEPYDPSRLPAQIASVGDRDVAWFLDQPAARLLPTV
jgi:6-phosphogluconolactonase/glucosamine-6-phosphate isomerase/deaminase